MKSCYILSSALALLALPAYAQLSIPDGTAPLGDPTLNASVGTLANISDTMYSNVNGSDTNTVKTGTVTGTTPLSTFEIPVNGSCQGCGDDLTAIFTPSQTANYTFAMASDDSGQVLLSTDVTAANAVPIITQEGAWTGSRQYNEESSQNGSIAANNFSAPIALVAGQQYFIEGIHAQGGGGQNFAVTAAAAVPEPTTMIAGAALLLGAFVRRPSSRSLSARSNLFPLE